MKNILPVCFYNKGIFILLMVEITIEANPETVSQKVLEKYFPRG